MAFSFTAVTGNVCDVKCDFSFLLLDSLFSHFPQCCSWVEGLGDKSEDFYRPSCSKACLVHLFSMRHSVFDNNSNDDYDDNDGTLVIV